MRIADLFCGAGGAGMGLSRAGFEVVGFDIEPQKNYPFEFHQADALAVDLSGFDAVWASPPCQAFSTIAKQNRTRSPSTYAHPDLIEPTRSLLISADLPWIIENVVGAPIRPDVKLCGSSFGLDLRRHRAFECGGWSAPLMLPCSHHWQKPRFRSLDKRRAGKLSSVVSVHGGGQHGALTTVVGVHGQINYTGEAELRREAMGIDWMSNAELVEAIPPAYSEYLGRQLIATLT